jgi:hypothetical protein
VELQAGTASAPLLLQLLLLHLALMVLQQQLQHFCLS